LYELFQDNFNPQKPDIILASLLETAHTFAGNMGRVDQDRKPIIDEKALAVYAEMIEQFYDSVPDLCVHGRDGKYVTNHLGRYLRFATQISHEPETHLLPKYIARFKQNEKDFAKHFLYDIEALVTNSSEDCIWTELHILQQMIDFQQPVLEQEVINILAKLRPYHPNKLDLFLENIQAPEDVIQQVWSVEVEEHLSDSLRPHALDMGVKLFQAPELLREMRWVFHVALQCHTLNELAKILFKKLANIAYGETIFDVPINVVPDG